MAKSMLGIDIGASELKLAVYSGNQIKRMVVADMPDNLVRDGRILSSEVMSQFIKETIKKEKVKARNCAVILPNSLAFTRTITLPAMSQEHLKINLPYEFRDFITQEKDKYFYDYAVTDNIYNEEGTLTEISLIAAATLKETIQEYSYMCRRAGLKLRTAVTDEILYMNLIRTYIKSHGTENEEKEFCFIDLGHTTTKLYIFKGIKFRAIRIVEYGCQMIDAAIADDLGVDEHIARAHKHSSHNTKELETPNCRNVYSSISMEVRRAINFFRFHSPDCELREVYLCGGGSRIQPLINEIKELLDDITICNIEEIFPKISCSSDDAVLFHKAISVTLQ